MKGQSSGYGFLAKLVSGAAFVAWALYVVYHYAAQFGPIGKVVRTRWFN